LCDVRAAEGLNFEHAQVDELVLQSARCSFKRKGAGSSQHGNRKLAEKKSREATKLGIKRIAV